MKPRLDDAIDQVAARMTHVGEDPMLASRIVSALPGRPAWSWHWLMPRLALTAALVIATTFAVLRTVDDVGPAEAGRHSVNVAQVQPAATPAVAGNVSGVPADVQLRPARVASVFRRTRIGRTDIASDQPDHEFSLPAIDAVAALGIDALAPANLSEDAPLTIESLEIASLPLTADFSQHR